MNLAMKDWKISSKILLISFVGIFLVFAAALLYILPTMEKEVSSERMMLNQRLVESAMSVVTTYAGMYERKELPLEVAQKEALEIVRTMRFDNGNYLFVTDTSPKMIMHPVNVDLVGKDLSDYKDPNGFLLFQAMSRIAKEKGSGGLSYVWQKPGAKKLVPKLSFIAYYAPWDWVVGTGCYSDDIAASIGKLRQKIVAGMAVLALIMLPVTLAISRMIVRPIKEVVGMLKDIAQGEGDLTKRLAITSRDEIGELAQWFNTFVDKLHDIILQVAQSTTQIASAAGELAATAEEMAAGSNEQTAQTAQVATSMEEMSATVQEVAKNSNLATGKAKTAGELAGKGGEVVSATVGSIDGIARSVRELQAVIQSLSKNSERIGDIVNVIDDVADQTNLLALNAAIEAARAGEQGRGFAVVADEVRKLAERTSTSTKEIANMVKSIQGETSKAVSSMEVNSKSVDEGVRLAQQAGKALGEIMTAARSVQEMIQQIATAAEQQSAAAEEISSNVESIASVSKQNTMASHDTATASQEISRLTDELNSLVGSFKLREKVAAIKRTAQPGSFAPVRKAAASRDGENAAGIPADTRGLARQDNG